MHATRDPRIKRRASLPPEIAEAFERKGHQGVGFLYSAPIHSLTLWCDLPTRPGLQCNSAQGLFPEISRAWFTIDSDIFLWDYVDGTDVCVYEELDELIDSVALVHPKRGVFPPEIE